MAGPPRLVLIGPAYDSDFSDLSWYFRQDGEISFGQVAIWPKDEMEETDRRILRELQRDGRITNQELARRCHLSPAACFERVKRLRERGVITGYAALLDPAKLDRALLIFVEVHLDRTTEETFERFANHVRRSPEILECHMVAGGFDYLIKARVKDMAAYRAFLGETLVAMPGVRETRTYAVLEEVKNTLELPV
jgi:Lrp/AsnC family leucine-responsive transcriptional regulator